MRSILTEDQEQLKLIEAKLAELTGMNAAEQARKQCLIDALRRSKTELMNSCGRLHRLRTLAA